MPWKVLAEIAARADRNLPPDLKRWLKF